MLVIPEDFPAFDYHGVRWRWCRAALLALLRRWAVFVAVVLAVVGVQAAYVLGALAWVLLPLMRAAAQGPLAAAGALMAYGLAGGLLLLTLQPLLLPRHWAATERALPLPAGALLRSDRWICAWALLPVALIDVLSCGVWLLQRPDWLLPVGGWAIALVVAALVMAWCLGVAGLQWARRPVARPSRAAGLRTRSAAFRIKPLAWWHALWLLAMWRGPARQLGLVSVLGLLALTACVTGVAVQPAWASWWLAGFAAVALLLVTRLHRLQLQQWPRWAPALAALPLSRRRLRLGARVLALLPVWLGLLLLVAVLAVGGMSVHRLALIGFFAACLIGPALQTLQRPDQVESDPSARAAFWFITLVLMLALASEVLPAA